MWLQCPDLIQSWLMCKCLWCKLNKNFFLLYNATSALTSIKKCICLYFPDQAPLVFYFFLHHLCQLQVELTWHREMWHQKLWTRAHLAEGKKSKWTLQKTDFRKRRRRRSYCDLNVKGVENKESQSFLWNTETPLGTRRLQDASSVTEGQHAKPMWHH